MFYNLINKNSYLFKDFFSLYVENVYSKRCNECQMQFRSSRQKKPLFFNSQITNWRFQQLPLNILKRGVISYNSINYYQHKNMYDFFDRENS